MRPATRDWVLVSAWLGSLALVRAGTVKERDPYWQVRAGLENLDGLPLSRPDTWGWEPVDTPFTQTSPAWNDVLALGWGAFGSVGIFFVALVALCLYLATVAVLGARLGARPVPVLVGTLACALPALAMLSPRATVVAQTLFLLGLAAADRWRRRAQRPSALVDAVVVLAGAAALVGVGSWAPPRGCSSPRRPSRRGPCCGCPGPPSRRPGPSSSPSRPRPGPSSGWQPGATEPTPGA